ncbi:MAG TPA: ABC transporter permease [Myxococcales bacterium]|nr:ABC transporter permease [Myxococcales bacterium]
MTPNPLWELTLTRLRLFFREPSAVFWTFGFPLALSLALGIAFRNRPPEPVRIGVVGTERTLDAADALRVSHFSDEASVRNALRTGNVDAAVLEREPIEILHDPTRPESRLARALANDAIQRAAGRTDAVRVAERAVTEPGSRYIDFLIPGLIGMNVMSSGMWGIGYVVVEMRTRKLLKRLVATPMSRAQFLWSFVLMRSAFLFIELPALLVFGWLAFQVGVAGSLLLLVAIALLGALCFSGIGLLVASRAQNTQTVSGIINAVMLPMFIGSGVFFSTARFPEWMQKPLRVLPLTALNDSMRAVMIDGAGPRAVAAPAALLAVLAAVSFALALRIFRWR